jgi:hypothetical protein
VPLSEDEQRILQEIERSFYDNDPAFAREVSSKTLYRHAGRNLKWAALGFIAGLAVLVVSFAQSLILGFAGFLVMLGSAFVFERNARKMGKAGLQSVSQRTGNLSDLLGERSKKLRERFRRDEER